MDGGGGGEHGFTNISATPAACEERQARFLRFLNEYVAQEADAEPASEPAQDEAAAAPAPQQPYYVEQLATMRERELNTVYVDFEHLADWDQALAADVADAHYRMEPYLRRAARAFVREHLPGYAERDDGGAREFWVSFHGLGHSDRLRALRSDKVGALTQFVGTVTRTTEVRPELFVGAFRCLQCMATAGGVEQQFKYTTPAICAQPACGNASKWSLVMEESTFVDWQKARVQENPDEVPAGSLPRTIDVVLRNDQVEGVRPGDKAVFTGSLVVVPDVAALTAPGERLQTRLAGVERGAPAEGVTGLVAGPARTGARELTYRLAFVACGVQALDQRGGMVNIRADDDLAPEEVLAAMSAPQRALVAGMRRDRALYDRLAASLAPNVFGHLDVKRAVLLMLLGGVPKRTREGIKLRGDINVAIVGDPACAKSQILKYVAAFLPRAVYTSGKSSSAAGLTASVVREADSGEFCIEAGALMLADNGICCIDEFDKMDVKDQVAIHEAMEQQTISIAKAGIQATLNARTSVLAAANPMGGRYDRAKPLRYNVALPPAILSRFDLLHVMVDEPDPHLDAAIANHILSVHTGAGAALNPPYGTEAMQCYIRYARAVRPGLPPAAQRALVAAYKRLRGDDAAPGTATAYRITVRQLEALVRLSEALARLHLREEVSRADVREAFRLVKNSIVHVDAPDAELADEDAYDGFAPGAAAAADIVGAEPGGDEGGEEGGAGGTCGGEGTGGAAAAAGDGGYGDARPTGGAAAAAGAAAGAAAAPPRRAVTKVPQAKYNNVKALLALRLRQLELGEGGAPAPGERRELGSASEVVGCAQRDLLRWYFEHLVARGAVASREAGVAEIVLAEKIVAHLVRREQVLLVVDQPERRAGEGSPEFARRCQNERVLALNPNFSVE